MLHRPSTVGEAVRVLAEVGDAELLAGGTDLVPAMRAGTRRPRAIVALRRVLELRARGVSADALTIGAGVTYAELVDWAPAPGLVATARAVGSAQIRNAGTVGGALGSANPRGDLLTFLTAADADVLTCSARRGPRTTGLADFLALAPGRRRGEIVTAVRMPPPRGPQAFLKIGGRQAAYPALVSCALVIDVAGGQVRCAVGGVATTPLRAEEAEAFATAEIDWSDIARSWRDAAGQQDMAPAGMSDGRDEAARAELARRFGALVAAAASAAPSQLPEGPRDPAAYRWHAVGVLAERALARCLTMTAKGAKADSAKADSAKAERAKAELPKAVPPKAEQVKADGPEGQSW